MMKLMKYEFKNEELKVNEEGEIELLDNGSESLSFCLLHSGHEIFEELYGKSVLEAISGFDLTKPQEQELDQDEVATQGMSNIFKNPKFILSLAAACYLKVENGKIINNIATANEFYSKPYAKQYTDDLDFVMQLVEVATSSLPEAKNNNDAVTNPNKKQKK